MVFEDVQIRQAVTAEEGQKVALAVLIAPDHRFNVSHRVNPSAQNTLKPGTHPLAALTLLTRSGLP